MKSIYHNSIFSNMNDPHLFIYYAYLFLNGMEQCKIEEALNLGHGRAGEWTKIIQDLCAEQNRMINVPLGGGGPEGRQVQEDGSYLGGGQKYGRG
jgi:hypothetical protein